jgi:hypothetical protein
VLAEFLCDNLIQGNSVLNIGAVGPLRMNARQISPAGALMHADFLARPLLGDIQIQARDNQQTVLEGSERLEQKRQLEVGALGRRRPLFHDSSVRNVDDGKALHRFRRSGQRRLHRIQQWQAQRRSQASYKSAARDGFLENHHGFCDLLI